MEIDRQIFSFPPLKPEIRLLIIYYLIFLSLLMGWSAGNRSRPVTTEVGGGAFAAYYREQEQDYDLRELTHQVDQEMEKNLADCDFIIKDRLWRLREKNGSLSLFWTESEVKADNPSSNAQSFEQIKKSLDTSFGSYGIYCRSIKGIQLGSMVHYRLIYGIVLGKTEIVTHRLTLTMEGTLPEKKSTLGLIPVPRENILKSSEKTFSETLPQPLIKPQSSPETPRKTPLPSLPKITKSTVPPPPIRKELPRKTGVRVAIIIDDFGFVTDEAEAYFSIREPLTIAVMPGGKHSREHALRARQVGFEVILHQPMEPLDRKADPGPGLIASFQSEDEMLAQFHSNLEDVPGATGFNNHMGSKGTQDPRVMRLLLSEAKRSGLFYIDSRSIAGTIGESVARDLGVAHAGRDVFLDHYGIDRVREQLDQLVKVALRKGEAIGIAHARPGVAEIIEEYIPTIKKAGIQIVPVSELLRDQ